MARRTVKKPAIKVGDDVTLKAEVSWVAEHLGLTTVRIQGYGYPVTLKLEGKREESDAITLGGHVTRVSKEGDQALVTIQISGADHPVTVLGNQLTKV